MKIADNEMNDLYLRKWEAYKSKQDKPLNRPGAGWLSSAACYENHCTATYEDNGNDVVCAAPLWKYPGDAYLCTGHLKERNKMVENNGGYVNMKIKDSDVGIKLRRLIDNIKNRI